MVDRSSNRTHRFAMVEIIAAMMILSVVIAVVTVNAAMERRRMRALYHRSVAEQVLDGYRDILAAGAWRQYSDGQHSMEIDATAFQALPDGDTILRISRRKGHVSFSLEWSAESPSGIGTVRKEADIPAGTVKMEE